jgi:hypothetical protein
MLRGNMIPRSRTKKNSSGFVGKGVTRDDKSRNEQFCREEELHWLYHCVCWELILIGTVLKPSTLFTHPEDTRFISLLKPVLEGL